jgi:hypothetical protein
MPLTQLISSIYDVIGTPLPDNTAIRFLHKTNGLQGVLDYVAVWQTVHSV